MANLSKNFTTDEFACKCGCGYDTPEPELVRMLQATRDLYGKPIKITSAHIYGKAVDIATPTGADRYMLIKALLASGFDRIGINFKSRFIHADIDDSKPHPTIFSY